jgi:hypothetical protein
MAHSEQWVGCRVDDVYGARVGRVCAVYLDRTTDEPLWLLVRTGRTRAIHQAVPVAGSACGNGHVWVPFLRGQIVSSPPISVQRPVSPRMEAALCRHYGIHPTRGEHPRGWETPGLYALGDPRDAGGWAAMRAAEHLVPAA